MPAESYGPPSAEDVRALYTERAQLVALLAALYPSSWEYTDPQAEGWPVVYVELPTGQASWHISPDDWPLFSHVPRNPAAQWDGHTTEQKYARIQAWSAVQHRRLPLTADAILINLVAHVVTEHFGTPFGHDSRPHLLLSKREAVALEILDGLSMLGVIRGPIPMTYEPLPPAEPAPAEESNG